MGRGPQQVIQVGDARQLLAEAVELGARLLACFFAITAWVRIRAVRLLVRTATIRKKNRAMTFAGSAIVKV